MNWEDLKTIQTHYNLAINGISKVLKLPKSTVERECGNNIKYKLINQKTLGLKIEDIIGVEGIYLMKKYNRKLY